MPIINVLFKIYKTYLKLQIFLFFKEALSVSIYVYI